MLATLFLAPSCTCSSWQQGRDRIPGLVRMVSGSILSLGNHFLDLLFYNPSDHAQFSSKSKIQNQKKEHVCFFQTSQE